MKKLLSILLILSLVFALAACGGAAEQGEQGEQGDPGETALDWPKKTITIICPYSAGGGSDLMSRAVGERLSEILGVSVIVEDMPGGSGGVGMANLAIAKPDGYTLILTAMGATSLTPLMSDVGYGYEEFAPICQVSETPTVITVNASSGITTWEELLAMAKADPKAVTYGSSGTGGAHHVAVASLLLEVENNADLFTHIAYEGGAAAVTALLGNHITATASIPSEPYPYIESGDFNCLLTLATERFSALPDVPCTADLGLKTIGGTWYGFAAPAGTDEAILDFLEETILDIMAEPEMVETFENLACPVILLGREDFTNKWIDNYNSIGSTLKAIGMM